MFCFGILRIFGGNRKKEENWKIWVKIGLLRRSVGNPCSGVDLRQGVRYHCGGEAEVTKCHLLGTPRCRIAALWRSYSSQRAVFGFLFPNTSYSYTDSLGTLIKV